MNIQKVEEMDAADPLAHFRQRFLLVEGKIYLDGNSLGALPLATPDRVGSLLKEEWGKDLITSWEKHGWLDLPLIVGSKIARMIGAQESEVVVCDSTSVNLFKVLAVALQLRAGRTVVISERSNFPTDLYMIQGLSAILGGTHTLRLVEHYEIEGAIDSSIAAVVLSHVDYLTGRMLDMAAITRRVHEMGALAIWDLSHSVGVVPLHLNRAEVDFAIGCGYKYLNGGPGAPAFLYVNRKHHNMAEQPLTGWFGHASPFAFETQYRPARGISQFLCGTPPVISLVSLEIGVDLMLEADRDQVREKSQALCSLFIDLVAQECREDEFQLSSPREPEERGSQVSLSHPHGYPIMQAILARGVVGDFRPPHTLRFGFSPMYVSFRDVWNAVGHLREVMESREWDQPQFYRHRRVT